MKRLEMRSKHPLAIRWCHWVNFPLLALMIWSGLWIYWANDVYRVGLGSFTLFHFFPEGFYGAFGLGHELAKGMAWHFFFVWFFAINGVVYVAYILFSGEWRYLAPNRQSFREAILVTLHDLRLWKGKLPERKFNGAQPQISEIEPRWAVVVRLHGVTGAQAAAVSGVILCAILQAKWESDKADSPPTV